MTDGLDITAALVRVAGLVDGICAAAGAEHDLTPQQAQLLNAVRGRPAPMSRLAAELRTGKPGMSGLVARAEAAGLIRRVPDLRDGRVLLIELTPRGRRAVDGYRRTVTGRVVAAVAPLNQRYREHLRQALSALVLAHEAPDTWPAASRSTASRSTASRSTASRSTAASGSARRRGPARPVGGSTAER